MKPEFNQLQAMTFVMVANRVGLVIMTIEQEQAMKDRMDVCPGHEQSEFVR